MECLTRHTMKILVFSDSHDNEEQLLKALALVPKFNIGAVFHCGDLVHPKMLTLMSELKVPVYYSMGNNEGEEEKLSYLASLYGFHMTIGAMEITLEDKKIAMTHYPELAKSLARSQKYDFVFYGHTHFRKKELIGERTILLNPGNTVGWRQEPYCAVVDLLTTKIEFVSLPLHTTQYCFE